MFEPVTRFATFVLYQVTVILGILLLPLAVLARRVGITLPLGRLVETATERYERTAR